MPTSGTTDNPCVCCAGLIPISMLCRQRGGTASLVGCSAYTSPSSPPKKYRRAQLSGSSTSDEWTNQFCSGPFDAGTVTCVYTGFIQYDAGTGLPTTGGSTVCNGVPIGTGAACGTFAEQCNVTYTYTPTTATRVDTANCCIQPNGNYLKSRASAESFVATLSDEDTNDDAIARLLAGAGGTWGGWSATANDGSACAPSVCCLAQWSIRTTGFDIAYNEAQFRVDGTSAGLTPLTNYTIKVDIYRRVSGSLGAYTLFETQDFPITTDADGNFAFFDGDVPNDEGFQTFSSRAYAVLAP